MALRQAIALVARPPASLLGGGKLFAHRGHVGLESGQPLLPALLVLHEGTLAARQLLALLAHALHAGLKQG